MVYTAEMKRELEEVIRSIDGVANIFWRWDDWKGCNCLRFQIRMRAFRICFSYNVIPVAYFYLDGYWLIDVERGKYLPSTVKQIVNTLCNILEIYDTEGTKKAITAFAEMEGYDFSGIYDELSQERMIRRLAGAYIREQKLECDRQGIMLSVVIALCNKALM